MFKQTELAYVFKSQETFYQSHDVSFTVSNVVLKSDVSIYPFIFSEYLKILQWEEDGRSGLGSQRNLA